MKIVQALQVRLTAEDQSRLKSGKTTNYEAQEFYWKGLQHSRKRTKPDNDLAIQYLEQSLSKDPNFASAHATLASTLRFRYAVGFERKPEVLERAKEHTARALEISPMHPEGMLMQGLLQREEGRLKEAMETLLKEYRANPNDAQCLYYLGNSYRDAGYFSRAIDFHKKAFEIEPFYFMNPYNLAIDYWVLGRAEELNRYATKIVELEPENFMGLMMKSYALGFLGHEKEAIDYMVKAMSAEPGHPDTYGKRAEVLQQFGRFDEAFKDIQYLIEKDPESLTGIEASIPFYLNIGKLKEAEHIIEYSLRRPLLPLAQGVDYRSLLFMAKGILRKEQGRDRESGEAFKQAQEQIERRLKDFPDSHTLLSMHGLILACRGDFLKAEAEVQKALAIFPEGNDVKFDLARLYAYQGKKEIALRYLREVMEAGRRDFEMMRTDWFFKALRKDAEFNAVIDSFKQKAKPTT
jgi:tetratricopeptide (TPR) repeat protein